MDNKIEHQFLPNFCTGNTVLVVVVIAELMAIVLTLMGGYYQPFRATTLALNSFFMQWVGLSAATLLCLLRQSLNRLPIGLAAMLVVLIVALDTLVLSVAAQALGNWIHGEPLWRNVITGEVVNSVIIAVLLTGMTMRYFYIQEELMRRRESELQSRIQALQSRIRPHFLFNSMNSIASLISVDPDTAEQVVEDLSQLFRASLTTHDEQVTLAQEVSLCRRYLHIEQLRLGDRLKLDWRVDESLLTQPIPLLTLQPLLENAVYHGIQSLPEGGTISVAIYRADNAVCLSITNPVPDVSRPHQGHRMAQDNIRYRLQALYGKVAQLDVSQLSGHYQITVRFPYADAT